MFGILEVRYMRPTLLNNKHKHKRGKRREKDHSYYSIGFLLTTSPSTRVRTLSPISGEMSLPNCCKVVRNLFSLLSCLAPQAGGNCWLAREEEEEEDGPLLKPLGGDGAPFNAVGEWLVPLVTERKREKGG